MLDKSLPQNIKEGVILNLFQDLIGSIAIDWRFRNKFGMTQRCFEIVSKAQRRSMNEFYEHEVTVTTVGARVEKPPGLGENR